MCSIAGAVSKLGKSVVEQTIEMLRVTRHRGPRSSGLATNRVVYHASSPDNLDIPRTGGTIAIGHNACTVGLRRGLAQPLPDSFSDSFTVLDGLLYNSEWSREGMPPHDNGTECDVEVIAHLVEENGFLPLIDAVVKTVQQLQGVYALAVIKGGQVALARDPLGVKPIYYGESNSVLAFSSERKALWRIGVKEARPLPPGHVCLMTCDGTAIFPASVLQRPRVVKSSMGEAAVRLEGKLRLAFENSLRGFRRVAVAFSGGVDSSLTAELVAASGAEVMLFTAGLKDSHDIEVSEKVASKLGYRHMVKTVRIDEVQDYIQRVVYAVEEAELMKVAVALPLYVAAESALQNGFDVIVSGQGGDELFGGYARYLQTLQVKGYDGLQDEMWRDVLRLSEVNLQRDDAVTKAHGLELSVPFLNLDVVHAAVSTPPELKISGPKDVLRKRVLRKVAKTVGLPEDVATLPKKAVQFGSGSERAIRQVARSLGYKCPSTYLQEVFRRAFGGYAGG